MKRRLAALMATFAAGLVMVGGAGTAVAAPAGDATQVRIDAILDAHPGAVQTGRTRVTFSNGVVLGLTSAGESDCPADAMCLWDDQTYTGQIEIIYSYVCDYALTINLKDTGFNDRASSWKNNTTRRVGTTYWDYDARGGVVWRMYPMQKAPTLPKEFNDEASAVNCYNLS
ncbi:hypothetical protein Asp14428_59250 [Actinoplanes sp. NBRC 14428]|uniref:Peptidase inhibitor family I36 n=1 Tax=Pseudosporangium ferrugineum TaxID=439699 RepID=A0A2T0SDB3_9ACTN|nr:peptidase inhibitor family I36 protein [Pseudosporangium ferrugineum]PRY31406.1 peptidase inhibitor family I36 [Pseudosporangium ferrugineum]BCJ54450.1 hypothetical protein Asp14428_59250 [Actinoplanes sp. NBRC 14428]